MSTMSDVPTDPAAHEVGRDLIMDIVEIVDSVDPLDNVKSVKSVDDVSSVNSVHNVHNVPNDAAAREAGRGLVMGIVDTVVTADIVHTDILDIVMSVNSVHNVSSVNRIQVSFINLDCSRPKNLNPSFC